MGFSTPIGGAPKFAGGADSSPILVLSHDPTLSPTAGALFQFGIFGGEYFWHLTSAVDQDWLNLALLLTKDYCERVGLDADPTIDPPVVVYRPGTVGNFNDESGAHYFMRVESANIWIPLTGDEHGVGVILRVLSVVGVSPVVQLLADEPSLHRAVLNLYGTGDYNEAYPHPSFSVGLVSAIIDNDYLSFPAPVGDAPAMLFEMKRTGGFVPTPGRFTVDLSGLVDGPGVANDIQNAIWAVLAVEGGGWDRASESLEGSALWAQFVLRTTKHESRQDPPAWHLATPDADFSGRWDLRGSWPLVDVGGGTYNNLTRYAPDEIVLRRVDVVHFADLVGVGGIPTILQVGPGFVDGAKHLSTSVHITTPLAAPTLATATVSVGKSTDHDVDEYCNTLDAMTLGGNKTGGTDPSNGALARLLLAVSLTGDVAANLTAGEIQITTLWTRGA